MSTTPNNANTSRITLNVMTQFEGVAGIPMGDTADLEFNTE